MLFFLRSFSKQFESEQVKARRMRFLLGLATVLVCPLVVFCTDICCQGLPRCYTSNSPCPDLPAPQCPDGTNVTMKVYTRKNLNNSQELTRDSIPSVYDGSLPTIYLVHGWTQNETYAYLRDMKDALLAKIKCNVIIVGWGWLARDPNYVQAAANTQTAGAELALRAAYTITKGRSSRKRQRCVGHSLGAHVCGFAGQEGNLATIAGLDPAGPLFDQQDSFCGLSRDSAPFVQVIYTNSPTADAAGVGTNYSRGHINFFPNGGGRQPGCEGDPFSAPGNWMAIFARGKLNSSALCGHHRSYEFFTESIRSSNCKARYEYSSVQALLSDSKSYHKTRPPRTMGYGVQQEKGLRGLFYLETNPESPFCQG